MGTMDAGPDTMELLSGQLIISMPKPGSMVSIVTVVSIVCLQGKHHFFPVACRLAE